MFSIFTLAIEFDCLFLAPAPPSPPPGYATERTNVPVGAYCFLQNLAEPFFVLFGIGPFFVSIYF